MTPAEILTARKLLRLTQAGLADALRLGRGGQRVVRAWEKGEHPPSGPAVVALGYMLREAAAAETARREAVRMRRPFL